MQIVKSKSLFENDSCERDVKKWKYSIDDVKGVPKIFPEKLSYLSNGNPNSYGLYNAVRGFKHCCASVDVWARK
jgi:hypothetical protein